MRSVQAVFLSLVAIFAISTGAHADTRSFEQVFRGFGAEVAALQSQAPQVQAAVFTSVYSGELHRRTPRARVGRSGIRLTCTNPYASIPFAFAITTSGKRATVNAGSGLVFRGFLKRNKFSGKTSYAGSRITLKLKIAANELSAGATITQRDFVARGAACDFPFTGRLFRIG